MEKFFHSVTLEKSKCKGCINCIKRCPTEAIRVQAGKAKIIKERCIDCGECIRVCPHHAKSAVHDPISCVESTRFKIALPPPSLYAQFNNLDGIDTVVNGLIAMGFDDVYEVSRAAEIISDATRRLMSEGKLARPVISSACPAVTRLIRVRFPNLIGHVLPLLAPVELAARLAKDRAVKKFGVKKEDIDTYFITPCPAKVSAVKAPIGTETSAVDYCISISDVYQKLLSCMKEDDSDNTVQTQTGRIGVGWGASGGEASALINEIYLAADGIENVIRVLEDLEDEKFSDIEFIELSACNGGCVGGVLTVENPYIAKTKLRKLKKNLAASLNVSDDIKTEWDIPLEFEPVMQLGSSFPESISMAKEMERIASHFPALDCGSCGAPSCHALAEDIIRGFAKEEDCIYKFKEKFASLTSQLSSLQRYKMDE